MSLSIIIPSCGRSTLEYTLLGALANINPAKGDEVIVVGPREPAIIKPFYDIRDDFKWLRFINGGCDADDMPLSRDAGYPSGAEERDYGLRNAKGTHVMVCDDDDVFLSSMRDDVTSALAVAPEAVHIFRVRYGEGKQWISPNAVNLRADWHRGLGPEYEWVLWGEPLLKLGEVGSCMCVFPNDKRLKWDMSGGKKNRDEDYWVVRNYVEATKTRPVFHEHVIGIIRPSADEVAHYLGVPRPVVLNYSKQGDSGGRG